MRKFIIKTLVYIICFFLVFSCIFLSVRYFSKFDIDDEKSMLIVGHSHPEHAFNDSLISKLYNYAHSGEAYFYTYHKAKKVIEQNQQIKIVFIGFSNNQINKEEMDDWTWGSMYLSLRLPQYAPFLEINECFMLFGNNKECFINTLPLVLNNNNNLIKDGFHSNISGGYLYSTRDKTDSLIIALKNKEKDIISERDSINYKLSDINIIYLSKLIKLCTENNIKPYLVRCPLHEKCSEYSSKYKNEPIFQRILSTRFADVEFLDFSKYPLHNSEFGDFSHLNYRGAKKFSIWFNQLIEDGLLEKTDKQNFINERIKTEVGKQACK